MPDLLEGKVCQEGVHGCVKPLVPLHCTDNSPIPFLAGSGSRLTGLMRRSSSAFPQTRKTWRANPVTKCTVIFWDPKAVRKTEVPEERK